MVEALLVGLFSFPGTIDPKRAHWARTQEDVKPISEPLTRILNRMGAAKIAELRKVADPVALAYGVSIVCLPSIVEEFNLAREHAAVRAARAASQHDRSNGKGNTNQAERTGGDDWNGGENLGALHRLSDHRRFVG